MFDETETAWKQKKKDKKENKLKKLHYYMAFKKKKFEFFPCKAV